MADREYHRQYWQDYKKHVYRVTINLTEKEKQQWQRAAQKCSPGKKIGQQIKDEALAYQNQERVPDQVLTDQLINHTRVLRGIGNNLNQVARHSNMFRQLIHKRQTLELLQQLEETAAAFIRKVTTHSKGV